MSITYSNLPSNKSTSAVVKGFDAFTNSAVELDASTFAAMKGFFASRGFQDSSADSISFIIIRQAKQDNINPMTILDTLTGFDNVEISALVAEILNYNRFKSSFLGYARQFNAASEVSRNILP